MVCRVVDYLTRRTAARNATPGGEAETAWHSARRAAAAVRRWASGQGILGEEGKTPAPGAAAARDASSPVYSLAGLRVVASWVAGLPYFRPSQPIPAMSSSRAVCQRCATPVMGPMRHCSASGTQRKRPWWVNGVGCASPSLSRGSGRALASTRRTSARAGRFNVRAVLATEPGSPAHPPAQWGRNTYTAHGCASA